MPFWLGQAPARPGSVRRDDATAASTAGGDRPPVGDRSNAAAAIRPSAVLVGKSAHREIGCERGARGRAWPADQNHQTPAGLRQRQGLANLKITRCAERRRIGGVSRQQQPGCHCWKPHTPRRGGLAMGVGRVRIGSAQP